MKILQSLHNYDLDTFDWCLRRRHLEHLVHASRWISKTADGHLYIIAALVCLGLREFSFFAVMTAALLVERGLYFILKKHFRRNRPPEAIPGFRSVVQPGDRFSFPSGHTSAAFLFTTLAVTFVPMLGWILYPWAVCVGMSRVLLGVHFPTDTIAGASLGTSVALLSLHFLVLV